MLIFQHRISETFQNYRCENYFPLHYCCSNQDGYHDAIFVIRAGCLRYERRDFVNEYLWGSPFVLELWYFSSSEVVCLLFPTIDDPTQFNLQNQQLVLFCLFWSEVWIILNSWKFQKKSHHEQEFFFQFLPAYFDYFSRAKLSVSSFMQPTWKLKSRGHYHLEFLS